MLKKNFCQRVHLVLNYLCNFRSYFSHRIKEKLFEKMCLKGFHRFYKMFLVTAISLPHRQL